MTTDVNPTEILVKILNVESASDEETRKFSDVSHDELCIAVEYWIDQCKLLFGEPVILYQNQSLRDAGVDVSMNLLTSEIKFGIQVKSYGDIQKDGFAKTVKMQITDSSKHKISKFILAFAGDLTDKSQSQKVRGFISEIGQMDNYEILIIPPEKLVTIYKAYKEKKHPLQFVALDYKEALKIMQGVGKNLSNDKRSVSVQLKVDFKHDIDESQYTKKLQYTIELDEDELDFLDNFENMHNTGQILTIPKEKFTKFKVFDNGKEVDDLDKLNYLKIIPEYQEEFVTIIGHSNPTEGTPILENARFIRRQLDSGAQITLHDPKHNAFRCEFTLTEKMINLRMAVNFANSDVYEIQKAIDMFEIFIQARVIEVKKNNLSLGMLDAYKEQQDIKEIDPYYKKLVSSLIVISEFSNKKFVFPLELKDVECNQIINIAEFLDKKESHQKSHLVRLLKKDAMKMIKQYQDNDIDKDTMLIKYEIPILGQKIKFDAIIELSKFKPKEEYDVLLNIIEKSKDKIIKFYLIAVDEENNIFLQ